MATKPELKQVSAKAETICNEIKAGLDSASSRADFWERLRGNYFNRTSGSGWLPYEGAVDTHYNLTQVMLDAMASQVVGNITAYDPYCVPIGGQNTSDAEQILQFFIEKDNFKESLKEVSSVAGWSNRGQIHCEWDKDKRGGPGFRFSVLEPMEVVVYPASAPNLEEAKLYGRKITRRKSQVRALIESGLYQDVPLESKTDEQVKDEVDGDHPTLRTEAVNDDDEKVTIWDCLRESEKGWERVVIAYDSKQILREEPWSYSAQRCGEFSYKACPRQDGYFPSTSIAYDLEQVQYDLNECNNRLLESLRYNAHGVTFTNGNAESAEVILKTEPGGVYGVDTEGMVDRNTKVDISHIPTAMATYIAHAERICRISGMSMGTASPQVQTATEAQIVGGGQQASIDEYIETFGAGVLEIFKFMQAALYEHRQDWLPVYGKHLKIQDAEMLAEPFIWRLTSKSLGASPSGRMQAASGLWQIAVDPESGYDKYELAGEMLQLAERQGFVSTAEIQKPREGTELIGWVSQQLGLDPKRVALAIAFAAEDESASIAPGMGEMAGQSMPSGFDAPPTEQLGASPL